MKIFNKIVKILFLILITSHASASEDLQYITFKSGKWVVDDMPSNIEDNTAICELSTRKYLCNKKEKELYKVDLKELEKELIFTKQLGY